MTLLEQCRKNINDYTKNYRLDSDVGELVEMIEEKLLQVSERGNDSTTIVFQYVETILKVENAINLKDKTKDYVYGLVRNVVKYFEDNGFECKIDDSYEGIIHLQVKFYMNYTGKVMQHIDRTYY